MKASSYYSRMLAIHSFLNKENKQLTANIDKSKYESLKQWSINNGCIFLHNISFPIAYGPYGYIGVKSNRNINENEAIIFISKKQMILSKEIQNDYLFIYDNITEKEDKTNIILILYLIDEESKGIDSFYKPYIDLFPQVDFITSWDNNTLQLLDDDNIIISISKMYNEMKNEYNKIITYPKYSQLSLDKFMFYYFHIQSRQFYIDDTCTALFPLAELFNHDNVNTRFEFYDSENYIFKHTESLCGKNMDDIQITSSYIYPINNVSYECIKEIIVPLDNMVNDNKPIHINKNDYFVFATSNGQTFKKGEQCFIKYSKLSNKSALMHYGFNTLINEDDNTIIYINIDKNNISKELLTYIKTYFIKHYKANSLKIKVKCRNICERLLHYNRIMYFYRNGKLYEYEQYVFDKEVEMDILKRSIEILEGRLKEMNERYRMENDLERLEKEMENGFKEIDEKMVNVLIYRIKQRVNLAHQIEMMECVKKELERRDDVKDYLGLVEWVVTLKGISDYESDDYCVVKILRFLTRQKIFVKK